MFKKLTLLLFTFILLSFCKSNAQVTVFASGINSNAIYLDGDDLYYADYDGSFFKFNISDIDLPTSSFIYDVGSDANSGIFSFTKNNTDIYYSTVDGAGFPEYGSLYKLDITTLSVTQLAEGPPLNTPINLEIKSGQLYYGNWTHIVGQHLKQINLASSPPITPTTYINIITESLTINGFTMYFGTDLGKIYKKNMLIGAAETLIYDGAVGRIRDLELFDSHLYFIDDDGIKRINPLDAVPVSQLIESPILVGSFEYHILIIILN